MTMEEIRIAVDCSGGEGAPQKVVAGLRRACRKLENVSFLLYGNKNQVDPLLERYRELKPFIKEFHHTEEVILDEDKPSQVLRSKKNSSLFLAIAAVKEGKAEAVVSAGNTGAYMSRAVLSLRLLEGIERPAIITRFPTRKKAVSVLDLGANASCSPSNLVQFALMGDAYARILSEEKDFFPSIKILNIGGEDGKGNDTVQKAHATLKEIKSISYDGFLEPNRIYDGDTHVIVTDGFTGNVLLKGIEGTARFLGGALFRTLRGNILGIIGGLFLIWPLLKLRKRLDPRIYNGAMFIGLKGICVKSHGNADDFSFSQSILMAYFLVQKKINEKIRHELEQLK